MVEDPVDAHRDFLRGERLDDVLVFLPDRTVSDPDAVAGRGYRTDGGTVLILPGDRGRDALQRAAGIDPMALAQEASGTDGTVARDCTKGQCPAAAAEPAAHHVQLVFAFAQEQTPGAGGRYERGDVIHAYAVCECGSAYGDRWVVGEE